MGGEGVIYLIPPLPSVQRYASVRLTPTVQRYVLVRFTSSINMPICSTFFIILKPPIETRISDMIIIKRYEY